MTEDKSPISAPGSLDCIFKPNSVAVIGASNRDGSVGRALFANILMNGYTGVVYPVNMTAKSVLGVKAYDSVLGIPDEVELAVLIVPALAVPTTLAECGQKKVKGAVVISAGFKELGPTGAQLEQAVTRRPADARLRFNLADALYKNGWLKGFFNLLEANREWLQVLTPRFVERASGFPSRSPCGNAACAGSARLPPMELRARSSFDAVIVETRPDDLRGQSRRPRLSFGMRSHALEAALDSAGLAARHCLAPVVRMNTRMSGSPGLSGTLWISFRCSFD